MNQPRTEAWSLKGSVITTLLATCCMMGGAPAHANLLTNGGFEEPAFVDDGNHYVKLIGAALTGWTTISIPGPNQGTVLFNTLYDAVSGGEGSQAIQIEDPGDAITQAFSTVVGQSYTVSFDLTAYSLYDRNGTCPCTSILGLEVGGASLSFTGHSGSYVTHSFEFTAIAPSTTLKFENIGDVDVGGNYPQLDNVSVIAVPEPSACALALAGLGVLGFVVRRRKIAAN